MYELTKKIISKYKSETNVYIRKEEYKKIEKKKKGGSK